MSDNYYTQHLDLVNLNDAVRWLDDQMMVGICDEKNGGIMGYVHHAHADLVTEALNLYHDLLKGEEE